MREETASWAKVIKEAGIKVGDKTYKLALLLAHVNQPPQTEATDYGRVRIEEKDMQAALLLSIEYVMPAGRSV